MQNIETLCEFLRTHWLIVSSTRCAGEASVDVTSQLTIDKAADTLSLPGALIDSVGTAQRSSASDFSEAGLLLAVTL